MSHGFSKACCTLPPAEAEYTHKGAFETVAGIKSYVVGPTDAKVAILYIYDIFGYSPQIQQGADLLASIGFRVVMPDLLGPNLAQGSWFDGSDAGNQALGQFFSAYPAKVDSHVDDVRKLIGALRAYGASTIAGIGACWGYKALAKSETGAELSALVGTHPSMVELSDVDVISCPTLLLCSSAESKEVCEGLYEALEKKNPGKNGISWYNDSEHGWMATRADLKDDSERETFHRGFSEAAAFIKKHTK